MALTPLVKWVGGKTRLLPALRARLPSVYRTYYEPFAGGAALFFACTVGNGVLGDTNASLMNLYQVVAQQPQALEAWLLVHRHAHVRKAYYYEIRAAWNQGVFRADPVAHAATFLYLNRTCYNGLWRVNKQGAFNTPRGDYAKPLFFDPARLAATARVLQRTRLLVGDYMTTTRTAGAGDFVYFDPPRTTPSRPQQILRPTPAKPLAARNKKRLPSMPRRCGAVVFTSCCRTTTPPSCVICIAALISAL